MGLVELVDWEEQVDPYVVFVVGGTWLSRRDPLYVPSEQHQLARLRDLVDNRVSLVYRLVGQLVVVEKEVVVEEVDSSVVVVVKLLDPVVLSDLLAFGLVLSQIPMLLPD